MITRILLTSLLLLCSGCVHVTQSLQLYADGSADVTLHYSIRQEDRALAEALRTSLARKPDGAESEPLPWFLDPMAAEDQFRHPGIAVERSRVYRRGGRDHAWISLHVKDVKSVAETGVLGDMRIADHDDGSRRLDFPVQRPDGEALPPESEEAVRRRALLADLRIRLEVHTPTRVLTTNGEKLDRDRVRWEFGADILEKQIPSELYVTFERPEPPRSSVEPE